MTADLVPDADAAPESGVALTIPPEPSSLRQDIHREVLDGADWQGRFGDGLGVGEVLWQDWGPALQGAGLDRPSFDAVVRGYRRELWFWVLGDRAWDQAAQGLAGRLRRRASSN